MAPDPRHLRARWTIAATGWLLWAMSLVMPAPGPSGHVFSIYPEAIHVVTVVRFVATNVGDVIQHASLFGFLLAMVSMAASPVLMGLNHSLAPKVRRWRWLGLGLLAIAQLTVMILAIGRPGGRGMHLLVFSHLLVCIAVIPWPRERAITGFGFEVVVPGQDQPSPPTAAEE